MFSFIKRNLWGFLLIPCFVAALALSFSATTAFLIWMGILASCGTGVAAIICFVHPFEPRPFIHVYSHESWHFGEGTEFPTLTIPVSTHKMGSTPHLEFRQGDFVFPWRVKDGSIVVIRNNHSIGCFNDLGVIIRRKVV